MNQDIHNAILTKKAKAICRTDRNEGRKRWPHIPSVTFYDYEPTTPIMQTLKFTGRNSEGLLGFIDIESASTTTTKTEAITMMQCSDDQLRNLFEFENGLEA